MASATWDGGDRWDVRVAAADETDPDRELVRLRAENLALKAELIELRLAASRGTARRSDDAGSGLRDLAAELRAAASSLEEAGLDLPREGPRPPRAARGGPPRPRRGARPAGRGG